MLNAQRHIANTSSSDDKCLFRRDFILILFSHFHYFCQIKANAYQVGREKTYNRIGSAF